mmetsp:Transcript_45432/g.125366  ORF Transcript_45432/g.125366 Transcript_45432/m.125366 type:complete len:239 (+) Transcript_45432:49-765(+)
MRRPAVHGLLHAPAARRTAAAQGGGATDPPQLHEERRRRLQHQRHGPEPLRHVQRERHHGRRGRLHNRALPHVRSQAGQGDRGTKADGPASRAQGPAASHDAGCTGCRSARDQRRRRRRAGCYGPALSRRPADAGRQVAHGPRLDALQTGGAAGACAAGDQGRLEGQGRHPEEARPARGQAARQGRGRRRHGRRPRALLATAGHDPPGRRERRHDDRGYAVEGRSDPSPAVAPEGAAG